MIDDPEHITELKMLGQGETAVADVFDKYREQLQRIVRFRMDPRLLGRIDTDDVLQEAYLEIDRRAVSFMKDAQVPFFIWARQITLQVLIDLHRMHLGAQMRSAKLEVSLHRSPGGSSNSYSLAAHLVGNMTSPSQVVLREERTEQLRIALDQMEEIDREVLILRHFEELSNSQVAEVLKIEKSTASKRYVRALGRLKDVFETFDE